MRYAIIIFLCTFKIIFHHNFIKIFTILTYVYQHVCHNNCLFTDLFINLHLDLFIIIYHLFIIDK